MNDQENIANLLTETSTYIDHQRAYCQQFALAHLDAFRPHYKIGEALGPGPDVWRKVSEHCLVEGIFADIIAEKAGMDPRDRDNIVRAAILHDWYKKHESIALSKLRQEGKLTLEALDQIKHEDSEELKKFGISEEVIALTRSNVPVDQFGPQTLQEQILWYVDAMMSNTEPLPIKERFVNLERGWDGEKEDPVRAARNNTFSDLYRLQYDGKSLYEMQVELADVIGAVLAQRIGYTGPIEELPIALKELFVARVESAT